MENYLLEQEWHDAVTLYLWANHRTVVVGRNQNPYAECNVELLEADGGYLMRRGTGGGAVYHDAGNLNFSFVVSKSLYDQGRQFSVLQHAVQQFGIESELSGRNDVLTGGRKFSGNAFSKGKYQDLHHGTILIRSNMDDLAHYLKPRPSKLQKHGVASVQSRVVNLSDLNPAITAQSIVDPLRKAFEEVYGGVAEAMDWDAVVRTEGVQRLHEQFASDQWRFGKWRQFEASRTARFEWGIVEVQFAVDEARHCIVDAKIATDALDLEAVAQAERLLRGADTVVPPVADNPIVKDIVGLVYA